MKNYAKRALSVFLAFLMCLSVVAVGLQHFVPESVAATAGSYSFRVVFTKKSEALNNGAMENSSGSVKVYYKPDNGTGTQTYSSFNMSENLLNTGDTRYWPSESGTTINGYPTKIGFSVIRNNNGTLYGRKYYSVQIWSNKENAWKEVASGAQDVSSHSSGNNPTYYYMSDVTISSGTPYAAYVIKGSNFSDKSLTLNATGGDAVTTSYSASVQDQYGVNWYADPSWTLSSNSCDASCSPATGASTTISIPAVSSTYAKHTITVTAKCGDASATASLTVTPTYKINYNVSGNGGTSPVPGPDNTTNTNTGSTNVTYTIPNNANYTPKKEKGSSSTGTWTFVGWNGSQSATTGSKAGQTITIDSYNDTLYAIFSKKGTANFYYYNSSGTRTTATASVKTVYNNAAQYTFDVPKSEVPATFVVNNTTYTFAGWAVDSTTKTTADVAKTATTAELDIKNGNLTDSYDFYALYTGSVKLTYDNNGGSGQPAAQTADLILNCGGNTSAANNTSGQATLTLNPDNVEMSRSYSSAFIGWKTAKTDSNGIDAETANYKDATVTWSASSELPETITISKNTTVYAAYYDFRYNVKFYDYKGTLKNTQSIRHNFSATAPEMQTDSSNPSHTDTGSHYVFDHWEYTDGSLYKDTDKLTKLVNGYTYEVWGKYVGHKHIWSDPYDIHGATTCTGGQTYKLKCTVCGYVRDFETEPLGHDFQVTGVAEPTCTRPGSYGKKTCVNCGASDPTYTAIIDGVETVVTDENRMIPALGHKYGVQNEDETWTYADMDNLTDAEGHFVVDPYQVEATCTTAGYYYYECARCGNVTRVGNIPANGHSWVTREALDATCTEAGYTGYTKCENCGLFLDGEERNIAALGHEYVEVEATDSTCTVAGHDAYWKCDRCGLFFEKTGEDTYTEIEDITTKDKPLAAHAYELSEDVIEPTCTEEGHTGAYVCAVCGAVDPERPGATVPANGHVWEREGFGGFETYAATYGDEFVVVYESAEPCADPSTVTYKCTDCDATHVVTADLADHTPEAHAAVNATCTEEGNIAYWTCEVCGKYFSDEACENEIEAAAVVIAKIPHTIVTIEGQAPTCTEAGIPDCYKCTVCLKLFKDAQGKKELTGELGTIPALDHNYTDWVVAVQPTDTEPGLEKRKCIRCGYVDERDIAANGHNMTFVPAKAATCTEDGNVAYYACSGCGKNFADEDGETEIENVVVEATGHALPDTPDETVPATCAAEGYNKFVCANCGLAVIVSIPKLAEHGEAIPYGENIPATCAAPGQEAGTMCSVCGAVLTQPTSVAKLAHTPEAERRDVRAATCTETGFTGDLYCSVCGLIIEAGTVIEANGHTLGALTEISPATCTDYGVKRRTCADCDYYEDIETPVLGHQIVTDKSKAPTCTETGITEGSHCSRCNAVLVVQEELPALGHSYSATVVAPTCTKLGYTEYVCANCGDTYKDTYTEKLAHVVGTPATCTEPAKCANCGRSFGEALGHEIRVYVEEASTPATCTASGTAVYKCTRCDVTSTETVPAKGHTFNESEVVYIAATCTEAGYAQATCTTCGEVITEEIEPALGHSYQNGECTRCGESDPNYTPDTPATPTSEKCPKCGLNHNGRTGLWKQDGFFCKIIAFFRNITKIFQK